MTSTARTRPAKTKHPSAPILGKNPEVKCLCTERYLKPENIHRATMFVATGMLVLFWLGLKGAAALLQWQCNGGNSITGTVVITRRGPRWLGRWWRWSRQMGAERSGDFIHYLRIQRTFSLNTSFREFMTSSRTPP